MFFDFDGVILDSIDVKTKAFEKMFEKYGPEIQKLVVQYHLENGGISRFDKFHYFYEKILGMVIGEEQIQTLSEKFSTLVVQQVIDSDFVDGAYETLKMLQRLAIPAFIVSGTPTAEINLIVREKGIERFFVEVHGSPRKKWEITKEIIRRERYVPTKCLFVGDSMSDYEAAEKAGISFLGIVPQNYTSPFPPGTKISNTVQLECFK